MKTWWNISSSAILAGRRQERPNVHPGAPGTMPTIIHCPPHFYHHYNLIIFASLIAILTNTSNDAFDCYLLWILNSAIVILTILYSHKSTTITISLTTIIIDNPHDHYHHHHHLLTRWLLEPSHGRTWADGSSSWGGRFSDLNIMIALDHLLDVDHNQMFIYMNIEHADHCHELLKNFMVLGTIHLSHDLDHRSQCQEREVCLCQVDQCQV